MIFSVLSKPLVLILALTAFHSGLSAALPAFTWAEVGDSGNADDVYFGGVGAVDYAFKMSAYETTNIQYAYFLNVVDPDGTNTNGLYASSMSTNAEGGIAFNTLAGAGAKYAVKSGYGAFPVVYVSWNSAARFVNWLHNGGSAVSNTENGVYDMTQVTPVRQAGATFWLPNEDEWHKAAYYDQSLNTGTGGYYLYPTQNNTQPVSILPNTTDPNSANFYDGGFTISTEVPEGTRHLAATGSYEVADSAYGTFDQGGNAAEWTERAAGSERGYRGGSWAYEGSDKLAASSRSTAGSATSLYGNVGFRVAAVPEPSVIALGILAGGVVLVRGLRRSVR